MPRELNALDDKALLLVFQAVEGTVNADDDYREAITDLMVQRFGSTVFDRLVHVYGQSNDPEDWVYWAATEPDNMLRAARMDDKNMLNMRREFEAVLDAKGIPHTYEHPGYVEFEVSGRRWSIGLDSYCYATEITDDGSQGEKVTIFMSEQDEPFQGADIIERWKISIPSAFAMGRGDRDA